MTEPIMCYIAPGKMIDLAAPDMESITIDHIAASLANQTRFNGALGFYSVARHSVAVAERLWREPDEVRLAGLLHDAHEALIGDITRPVQRLLGEECRDALRREADYYDALICKRFGLPEGAFRDLRVINADNEQLAWELEQAASGEYLSSERCHDFSAFVEVFERLQRKDM